VLQPPLWKVGKLGKDDAPEATLAVDVGQKQAAPWLMHAVTLSVLTIAADNGIHDMHGGEPGMSDAQKTAGIGVVKPKSARASTVKGARATSRQQALGVTVKTVTGGVNATPAADTKVADAVAQS
jgi:hypothetical protein